MGNEHCESKCIFECRGHGGGYVLFHGSLPNPGDESAGMGAFEKKYRCRGQGRSRRGEHAARPPEIGEGGRHEGQDLDAD